MTNTKTDKESWDMATEEKHTPEVIAYRVGELERKTTGGFAALNKKLDDYLSTFTTKEELKTAQEAADKEHLAIYKKMQEDYVPLDDYNKLKSKISILFWAITIVGGVTLTFLTQRFIAWLLSGGLQ